MHLMSVHFTGVHLVGVRLVAENFDLALLSLSAAAGVILGAE